MANPGLFSGTTFSGRPFGLVARFRKIRLFPPYRAQNSLVEVESGNAVLNSSPLHFIEPR
jgi:hypothetical protein